MSSSNTTVQFLKTAPAADKPKISLKPWFVCFSAAMFFFYDFIQMNMCNSLSLALMRDFNIDATGLGYLSFSFLAADVLFLFPAGLMLDRLSVRSITLSMLFLSIAGTLGLALTDSFSWACAFHFISGVAHAFCFLCCIILASRWFPPKRQAFVIGLIVTIAMLGGLVAQTPLSMLSDWVGWRTALLLDTVLGVGILVMVWLTVEDYPKEDLGKDEERKKALAAMGFWESLKKAVSNTQNWLYGIYTGLLNLPIMLFGAVWGVLYLTQVHHIEKTQATVISMMIYFGTIIGAPLTGWLSDKIGRRRLPMILGALISLVIILMILFIPGLSGLSLGILFFLLGLMTSTQVVSYPAIAESNDKAISGTSMGFACCLIMGLGGVSQPLSGWLLDLSWDGRILDSVPIYTHDNYLLALSIIPIGFVLGLIASLLVKETYCQPLNGNGKENS